MLNTGGLALLNLRNLGANRTLVLVDGRRHVGAPQGQLQVDVDTIPTSLIETVEIVTGGSSAVYGADAVSGVVNFVMRRDFEGLEVDTALSQINKNGELNGRVSVTIGENLFDDRLNVYGFAEYQENEPVKDADIAWRRRGAILLGVDADLTGPLNDGLLDNIVVSGLNDLRTTPGGILTLAGQVLPTANIAVLPCATASANTPSNAASIYGGGNLSQAGNCFAADPGRSFVFGPDGVARGANFGSFRSTVGYHRTLTVGGDGENTLTGLSQVDRIPASNQKRFQVGTNFDLTDDIQLFAEAKYVEEENFYRGQPAFFDIGIGALSANTTPYIASSSYFNIGLDNAYLDPAVRLAIQNNTRPVLTNGVVTGSVADARAVFSIITRDISADRSQLNKRTVERYVAGVRGDRDQLGFVKDLSWEISGTYGKVENYNLEGDSLDVERFQFSVDAVRDVLGVVNGRPNEIVCRVKLLAAQGVAIPDRIRGGTLSPTSAQVQQCVPGRIFGTGGFDQTAKDYVAAEVFTTHINEQTDAIAFASGNLWDFWGAGPIGVAAGFEYRKEETVGVGRAQSVGDRFLFLNSSADFPYASYETEEAFAEVRIPLLRDLPGAELLELSGAYRLSDYTTVGETETYNATLVYRPISDVLLRSSVGKAVRVPSLFETFSPASQTFGNGYVDPCDFQQIRAQTPEIAANRRANCTALLGAGYNPDSTSIVQASVSGFNQGNPFLTPEESDSFTFSVAYTPSFIPNFSVILDYYDIEITGAIAAVTFQQAANRCVSGSTLDAAACATITRAGANAVNPFVPTSFIQGSINFAATNNSGVDFTVRYNQDLEELIGRDWGNISYALRGNWLIRQDDFTNLSNPAQQTSFAGTLELPRVRFLQSITYAPIDRFSVTWNMEFQTAQQLVDKLTALTNGDTRAYSQWFTQDYFQHDLTARWQVTDQVVLRGGVVNVLDREPDVYLGNTTADTFDFYGRRFFVGLNFKY